MVGGGRWRRLCERVLFCAVKKALQDAGINIVGNRLDNLFILHKKRAVIEDSNAIDLTNESEDEDERD